MSLVVQEMQSRAIEIQRRLRYPANSVRDLGIDLKRKVIKIPFNHEDIQQSVPITSLDVFGPKLLSIDDLAFGPIVHPCGFILRNYRTEDIQRAVARKFGLTKAELLSERRDRMIVRPRQIAMYLCKRMTKRSLPEIGRRFGGMDHTTVIHAVRKIEALRQTDSALNEVVSELIATVQADARI